MELIIKCEECGKNICVEVDDYDPAEMCDIDYTCPICGYDGTYTLESLEVNDDDDEIFDIDYPYPICSYESTYDLESVEEENDDDESNLES